MTHMLKERLKELAEDAEKEKALKDVIDATTMEKSKAVEAAEKRAQSSEKACQLAKEKVAEVEGRLKGAKLKLIEAASLNLAQADQMADLKAALDAYESKWYDEGFADAEKSAGPIVHQAWLHEFGKGWLAVL